MANMLRNGAQWLSDRQEQHTSSPVTYIQGQDSYPDIPAVIGGIIDDEAGAYDDFVLSRLADFIIPIAHLPIIPKQGDRIIFDGQRYEVIPNAFEGPYRYSDQYRIRYRIHTQNIGPDQ